MSAYHAASFAHSEVEIALRRIPAEFATYYNRQDIHKIVSLFSDDGIAMQPLREPAQGHLALRRMYEETFQQADPQNFKIEISHVEYDDNIAFEHGCFKGSFRLPDGTRFEDKGKWLATLRRERNDHWRLAGLCWNTSLLAHR